MAALVVVVVSYSCAAMVASVVVVMGVVVVAVLVGGGGNGGRGPWTGGRWRSSGDIDGFPGCSAASCWVAAVVVVAGTG